MLAHLPTSEGWKAEIAYCYRVQYEYTSLARAELGTTYRVEDQFARSKAMQIGFSSSCSRDGRM